jgi:hypothetical protein
MRRRQRALLTTVMLDGDIASAPNSSGASARGGLI